MTWAGRTLGRFRSRRALLLAAVGVGVVVVLLDAAVVDRLPTDPPPSVAPPSPDMADAPPPASTVSTPPTASATIQPRRRITVAESWVSAVSARTGVPPRALTAYANAQLNSQPDCHMSWTLLAGIGAVESAHGSAGGASLQADGTTSVEILGPALDGRGGTAAVPATPEGRRLDGDAVWDHAIGPMQFIPSTWSRWAVSADGGTPNPNDIDDAALTAARYLCAAGGDVATAAGWQAAIAAYNAPAGYAVRVTDQANVYARLSRA